MLLSMTGHGESLLQRDNLSVAVEVRTLNSRYFKLTVRAGECFLSLEPRIEVVVRKRVRRGTVLVGLRIDREAAAERYRINGKVLQGYRDQLEHLSSAQQVPTAVRLESLLLLPGVVDEQAGELGCSEADWPLIEEALDVALASLDEMRREEGQAMALDLDANCAAVAEQLDQIVERRPAGGSELSHPLDGAVEQDPGRARRRSWSRPM